MVEERRGAPRHPVPDDVRAEVGGIAVRLLELSLIGAKVEHQERFPLTSPQLTIRWRGKSASITVRAARSQIVGRQAEQLVYHTGLSIVTIDDGARALLSSILGETVPTPPVESAPAPQPQPSADDSWIRQVNLLRREELDEELPYAQFRLTPTGWEKDYVGSPAQPADGFTIPRERHDFHELQRTFEAADPDTRRMMQIALESQLQQK